MTDSASDAALGEFSQLRRFVLEAHPVRGFWIRIDDAWRELRAYRRYSAPVEALLGEAVTASVLLAATLKFQGTLTLQLQGDGQVPFLVAQCTHDYNVRALARSADAHSDAAAPADFAALVGRGRMTVTIDADERASRYQGIVDLKGDSLAACLENYFDYSEQLPTRIRLYADAQRAGGLLVQKLPRASSEGEALAAVSQQAWEDVQSRLAALEPALLQLGPVEQILQQVCGEHDCRLFEPLAVRAGCRCSTERIIGLLRALGAEEVGSIIAELGMVSVTCEFCGRPYRFDAVDVERLFATGPVAPPPATLN